MSGDADTSTGNLAAGRRHVEVDSSVRALRRGAAKGMLPEKKRGPLEGAESASFLFFEPHQFPASRSSVCVHIACCSLQVYYWIIS